MTSNQLKFGCLPPETQKALLLVGLEVERAKAKHPKWSTDNVYRALIVCEEAGELAQAALQHAEEGGELSRVGKEAVHTAATAVRLIEELNQGN